MRGRSAIWTIPMALLGAAALIAAGQVQLPEGGSKKTVEAACASCHGLDVVVDKKLSREAWQAVVKTMVDRGASLSKDEAVDVVGYLAKNFGKKERGRELIEDVCTYCHSLAKLTGQELSKEEWRDLIKGMIFEGAPVTDEEFSVILDYLAKNFGKRDP
jgi:cytochrome c5